MTIEWRWLGLQDYDHSLELQLRLHEDVRSGQHPGCILGLEHERVVTLGVRGQESEEDLPGLSLLKEQGWNIRKVDRGGMATLHEPGQLVIYPILRWSDFGWSPRRYVEVLLEVSAEALRAAGVSAVADMDRGGVYCGDAKIGFCGLRLDRGVSRHGISLNIRNSVRSFEMIRPCGIQKAPMTTLADQPGDTPRPEQFFDRWRASWPI